MGMKKRILITLGIGALLIVGFFIITEAITKYTGFSVNVVDNSFEKCLKEQDVTLYVNSEDVVESLRGIGLVNFLEDVKIFNCLTNNKVCVNAGVSNFPSWVVNGEIIDRDINLNKLEEYSGCKFVE